eukprot:TRINITY_DN1532_c0_g1_i1.p1 TRINITY_DN1532_c0_g1~~TRINITY_DN1532_c0_g1_i1.p1  ORF type:complete len:191 (-),score=38.44 TRINITY_DN1532_c0_g1_i1:81-653(-)
MGDKREVKCVIVGDGAVGKTCMLISYTEGRFPEDYVPTVFDNYEAQVLVEGQEVTFSLWDTAGQEGYQRIRVLSYPKTDIFLLCFSLVNRNSFDNVQEVWLPELKHHCPGTPIILVGTKSDLKEGSSDGIKQEEGEKLAKLIGAKMFLVCSAKTRAGLKEVFDSALTTVVIGGSGPAPPTSSKRRGCALF